jgi:DNA-binding NarL/FixJ family response regulator
MTATIRVVLVDDHHLFRAGVRAELAGTFQIVGEAATVAEAICVIGDCAPDVVLLDVHLPDGGGKAVLDALRGQAADCGGPERDAPAFLALSVSDAPEDVVPVVRAGARGYVTKTIETAALVDAIERVHQGDAYFSPRLAAFVLQAFSAPEPAVPHADPELEQLTPRERDVLHHLARGYPYKRIASRLGISPRTVETHVSSVLRKLQLSTRHELSRWASLRGLAEADEPGPGKPRAGR